MGAILGQIRPRSRLKWRGSLYRPAVPETVALRDPVFPGTDYWGVAKR
jgi:hypothetical protein